MPTITNVLEALTFQVRDWALAQNGVSVTGYCALASAELHRRLAEEGIRAQYCYTLNHVWVQVRGGVGMHLDPTAEQYGQPGPYLGLDYPPYVGYPNAVRIPRTIDLIAQMFCDDWAVLQIPTGASR